MFTFPPLYCLRSIAENEKKVSQEKKIIAKIEISICPFALQSSVSLKITNGEHAVDVCLNLEALKEKFDKITLKSALHQKGSIKANSAIQAYVSNIAGQQLFIIKLYDGVPMSSVVVHQDEWKAALKKVYDTYYEILNEPVPMQVAA